MKYNTIISAEELNENLDNPDWVIMDCRFSLSDPDAGFRLYRHEHIPHARFADLDEDLSGPKTDFRGRHPLPDFSQLVKKLGEWGINNNAQVIVYDDLSGTFAGRLWWLLRCLGHYQVAVLDGGLKYWEKKGYPITTALPAIKTTVFRPYPGDDCRLTARMLEDSLAQKNICLIDARTEERFLGKHEAIDPVAGHVPGAINRPFQLNLTEEGKFLPPQQLRQEFERLIKNKELNHVIHMCGSGVTACQNLLAMEIAGLSGSRIYPGSWSEWIRNRNRAVANSKYLTNYV